MKTAGDQLTVTESIMTLSSRKQYQSM